MRRSTSIGSALAAAAMAAFFIGCEGPCQALAERICSCEPNQTEMQSCTLKVDIRKNLPVSTNEAEQCSQLLDQCTCDALDNEDYHLCGISPPPSGG